MNISLAAFLGGWEIVLILAVVLILFGAKKLPELAKGLGHGIKEFKKATSDVTNELQRAADVNEYEQPRQVQYRPPEKTIEAGSAPAATPTAQPHPAESTPKA